MKNDRRWMVLAGLVPAIFSAVLFAQDGADKTLTLKIGDPRFKDKTIEVAPGLIYAMETGKPIAFEKMIQEMKGIPLIHVGETHNSLPIHELQARILRALYEQDHRIALGLEMYPTTLQEPLSKWSLGILTEDEFIREGQWYVAWNQNFAFYRPIFAFAKSKAIPLYGLNAPREVISKIRMQGWDALTEAEKALVPKPDLTHKEHRELLRTIFGGEHLPPQMKGAGTDMMFEGLYRGQSAWDEVMGFNAVRVHDLDKRQVVVLAGSGHLLYNLGLNRRAFEKSQLPFKTVVAVAVPKGMPAFAVSRSLADYIVGIPEEERPAYPSVGIGFKKFKGLDNLVVEAKPFDGVALGQDFEKGDVVLSVDGKTYSDVNELRTSLARNVWDAEVR
ncbi:MAG: ChaN family lipoprotein, partial [Candidatus Aminicenantales bacterium]